MMKHAVVNDTVDIVLTTSAMPGDNVNDMAVFVNDGLVNVNNEIMAIIGRTVVATDTDENGRVIIMAVFVSNTANVEQPSIKHQVGHATEKEGAIIKGNV